MHASAGEGCHTHDACIGVLGEGYLARFLVVARFTVNGEHLASDITGDATGHGETWGDACIEARLSQHLHWTGAIDEIKAVLVRRSHERGTPRIKPQETGSMHPEDR